MALREGACCCRSVVWLRRSLAFQTRIVEKISREHGCSDAPKCGRPLKKLAAEAYAIELEEFHNWVVRSTFQLAMNAMPSKEEILARLRGTGELKVTEQVVYADMGALAVAQRRVVRAIGQALVELDIDRTALARE